MKAAAVGLQTSVVSSYDKTKTTILGRVFQKTINSQSVLGPPLTEFIDVQTTAGITPAMQYFNPNTNRLFIVTVPTTGVVNLALYTFAVSTGVYSFVGKLAFNVPNLAATTHTLRSFTVNDNGATWDLFIATTGTVLVNGGLFCIHKVTAADFVPTGFATLGFATGSDQKAVYSLQDPSAVGSANAQTLAVGVEAPWQAASGTINTKVYLMNNSTTPTFYAYDLSTAPTVAGIQTGVTVSVAAPGVVTTPAPHGFAALDQITFTAGTLPTGLTLGTTYFVVAAGLGASTFSVSATSGGAAITTTGTPGSGLTVMRAFGISTNTFSFKTGVLPSITAALQNGSFAYAMPAANANATLNGQDCFAFAAASQLYIGKISDLTSGVTTWPSLLGVNITGTGIDITAPTVLFARYSTLADNWVYITNTSTFILKKHQSNQITSVFGGLSNQYLEGTNPVTVSAAFAAVQSMAIYGGWLMVTGSTIGQRGIVAIDIRSDASVDYSYIVSPVIASLGQTMTTIQTVEQLFDYTNSMQFYYRTAATSADAIFSASTGSWTAISTATDLSAITLNAFTQFKVSFYIFSLFANTPAQIRELYYSYNAIGELSDRWEGSADNTTLNGSSPCRTAFRMIAAYSTVVPTLFFRAYDDSGNLVASANTVTNAANFEYSTNNGTSWVALGTIANVAFTTELRYNWTSPPGVRVTVSISET